MTILAGLLFAAACAVSGGLWLLYRARGIRRADEAYGLDSPFLPHLASAIGAAGGLSSGLVILYYLSIARRFNAIELVGWGSYVLIAGASAGHILVLAHVGRHLWRERRAWARPRGPAEGTLGHRRLRQLELLRREHRHALDLRARDDEVVDELVGVLGSPLLGVRRDLSRIPFYGYLGTVCGILLMAQELGGINEATETFQVLSSMSGGLVLAFQTTLVALVAFLPLRKATDYLVELLGRLEEAWTRARDEALG
ncbi:MAG: MotA/TolQ/ExbB proton channel family protein [Gemmatimonadota bacterium]